MININKDISEERENSEQDWGRNNKEIMPEIEMGLNQYVYLDTIYMQSLGHTVQPLSIGSK